MNYLLGLDIGGTSVKGVAVMPDGHLVQRYHEPFDLDHPMGFALAADAILKKAASSLGQPSGIGVSAPGIAGREGRFIDFMPGRFEGLEKLDWGNRFGRPEGVPVLNDAHAALLGEVWLGAARNAQDAVLLTLGTGVGGAILSEGRLLRGHAGKGGHLGHMSLDPEGPPDICNAPGSLESAIGNLNIAERSGGRFATTLDMIQAHEQGDPEATRVWLHSVKHLAAAIASLGNILDPEIVILGGGISRSGRALLDPLEKFLEAMEWRPGGRHLRLALAELGDLAGAYGAAHHSLKNAQIH
jgi:glucokinase